MLKAAGSIPNLFASIGGLRPAVLDAYLDANTVIANGTLNKHDIETINLVVSAATGCDYCLAAHNQIAKSAGLSADTIAKLRNGEFTGEAKLDALAHFTHLLVTTRGTLDRNEFAAIKSAGYTDRQLIDISFAISLIFFTNTFNWINDTALDFPPIQ